MSPRGEVTPEEFAQRTSALEAELRKVIVGQAALLDETITALLAGGHVLLEGVPGLGKTVLVRTLADALDLSFSRLQFTPDLMPADIVGTNIISDEGGSRRFVYQQGPVFANLVLADEINRATPKTQSALLEAMQEHAVTVSGETRPLPEPFFVMATQNPIELEGTYPLPEAQLDRFLFKVLVPFPSPDELAEISRRTTGEASASARRALDAAGLSAMIRLARAVPIADHVTSYAVRVVTETHPDRTSVDRVRAYVRFGASPRGLQALVRGAKVRALRHGRFNVAFEDIRALALPALRHRVLLNYEADAAGITSDAIIGDVMSAVVADPAAA